MHIPRSCKESYKAERARQMSKKESAVLKTSYEHTYHEERRRTTEMTRPTKEQMCGRDYDDDEQENTMRDMQETADRCRRGKAQIRVQQQRDLVPV